MPDLLEAQQVLAKRPSTREFFDQMIAKYPDRLNPATVWCSAAQ